MSQQQTRETDVKPIAQAVNGFEMMDARQQTIHCWTVTSWRNDTKTAHQVNLYEGSCTCADFAFNKEGSEVCDHYLVANHYANKWMDVGEALNYELLERIQSLESRETPHTEPDADGDADPVEDGEPTKTAQERALGAAQELQAATDDMALDAQAHEGVVWLQTTKDAPDGLFAEAIQEPDAVDYVHEDHELHDKKPGEWWKNVIQPGDVEDYIAEVTDGE